MIKNRILHIKIIFKTYLKIFKVYKHIFILPKLENSFQNSYHLKCLQLNLSFFANF